MSSSSSAETWVPRLQRAQTDNHAELKRLLAQLQQALLSGTDVDAKESHTLINQQLKKYHILVSKCAKRLDGLHDSVSDINIPSTDCGGSSGTAEADPYMKFCADHICHLAKRKAAEMLSDNDAFMLTSAQEKYMQDISPVLEALQSSNGVSMAEDWVLDQYRAGCLDEELCDRLAYRILKINFLSSLRESSVVGDEKAIDMSRNLFPIFYNKNIECKELNELISCLLFSKKDRSTINFDGSGLESPAPWQFLYPHLSVSVAIQEACDSFREAAALAHGLDPVTSLRTLLRRGFQTASLIQESNLVSRNTTQTWENLEHVCVSASSRSTHISDCPATSSESNFHSIFTCPVSRELATKDNLPVLLHCGHVVLSSSMKSLPTSRAGRIKCPTCYHEMKKDSGLILHL